MPRTVSASEAKTRFGAMMDLAAESQEEIIVESYGKPRVVIIPFEEYQKMAELREVARRQDALARLENLRDRIQARNRGLGASEADALADELVEEAIAAMVREGKTRYQG